MKCATLILFCLVATDLITAYPLSLGWSEAARSNGLINTTGRKDQLLAQEDAWKVIAQLFQGQAGEKTTLGDAEMEGFTSFFNNLKHKFQEFGKRTRHAFKPSGK